MRQAIRGEFHQDLAANSKIRGPYRPGRIDRRETEEQIIHVTILAKILGLRLRQTCDCAVPWVLDCHLAYTSISAIVWLL